MMLDVSKLRSDVIERATYQPQELVPHRYWMEPSICESDSPTTQAILWEYYEFLRTFSSLALVDGFGTLTVIKQSSSQFGIHDVNGDMGKHFWGLNAWAPYGYEIPLVTQAEMAADLFIGFSIWNFLERKDKYHDDADLIVQLGADINHHLSILHFERNLDDRNFSKQVYDYFTDSPEKYALLSQKLSDKLTKLGIDPLIGNIRMYYNEANKNLSWSFFNSGVIGGYIEKYSPYGDHTVCAVCGIDGSGKTTLLNKLGRVVLPIAHPEDLHMKKFFEAFGINNFDYQKNLELFVSMRTNVLKKDLILVAFRYVRNLLAFLDHQYSPLTIFQNVVLDRSSLTNLAYISNPHEFGEAISEFVMDNFLNPRVIAVIDTPVSIAYSRAVNARDGNDEFDNVDLRIYKTRATMYRILAKVLPNVKILNTYSSINDKIFPPEVLVKKLKLLLYG